MKRRTLIILGILAAVALLVTRRSLWVAAIRRKWGPRAPFVLDYDASFWATLSLGELISAYFSGLPTWSSGPPGTGAGTFNP